MSLFRRAALRAITSTPSTTPFARNSRSLSTAIRSSPSTSFTRIVGAHSSKLVLNFRRSYATEEEQKNEDESRTVVEAVTETAEKARDAVSSAVASGIDSVMPERSGRSDRGDRYQRNDRGGDRGDRGDRGERKPFAARPEAPPSASLYVGNLYFEVTEPTLKREFEKYGAIKSAKIIYDGRGLSKGFGYLEFDSESAATTARNALDGQVLEGRRLAVQYAVKRADAPRRETNAQGFTNPPSKTLFIGNMSYEMNDKDLNDLFREVQNVMDVRVAIDRRTGQPRGFAHADFIDTKSAEAAAEYLRSKEFYGRMLKIDFSAASSNSGGDRGERGPRRDREER